jgi:hypothetical protein
MQAEKKQEPRSLFRNPFLYTSALIVLALLYVGFVFSSRWLENREIERRARERRRAVDERTVEYMGGNRLEIQNFYASPGTIRPGETAQLCYGVANAKTVKLEPQDNPVWPSYARCVDVSPRKDTTYTLTAEDAKGNVRTATLTLRVR